MVMKDISLYLFLGQLIIDSCLPCPNTAFINDTQYENMPSNCKKAFQVSINSTGSNPKETDDIILVCVHNLTNLNLTVGWMKNKKEIKENFNKSKLDLKMFSPIDGLYICYVNSSCGNYESSPYNVTSKNNGVYILVICGVSSLVLVLIMGLAMKIKLKRDNAKHRERMEQRVQVGGTGGPATFMPRQS